MKRKHYLLDLFNGVEDRFVMEAVESREPARPIVRKKRMILIAAVVALALLLTGCVAVFLRLQDMAVGSETYTKQFDDQGKALEEPVERARQIITFSGYADSPTQKAIKEWFAFQESYDPEHKLMTNTPDLPDIPNNYEYVYGCYTQEMVRKLDEIAAKYGVKLLDEWVPIQRWQSDVALEAMGVTSLLKDGAQASMESVSGMLFPPYNFSLEFDFTLTGENAAWTKEVWADACYCHREYLPEDSAWYVDLDAYDQWNYTTSDGVKLLMAMHKNGGDGFMVAEQKDGFLTVAISGNSTRSAYPTPDQLPGKEALEQMAEAFDFTFQPQAIDAAAMQPKLDAAEEAYQAAHTYVEPTYGDFTQLMKESNRYWAFDMQYTFYDINEDGAEELLLGFDGMVQYWYTIQDGTVKETMTRNGYLCEDGLLESVDTMNQYSSFLRYTYFKLDKGVCASSEPKNLTYYKGKWYHTEQALWLDTFDTAPTISEEEAKAIRAKHPHIPLDWKPIFEYPLDDNGTTLGDYAREQDARLSDQELTKIYADMLRRSNADWRTHYRILDINGDGVKDLLLSGDGEHYWEAFTYRYGAIQHLTSGDFFLCEDGVIESVGLRHEEPGIEIEEYGFYTLNGFEKTYLDYTAYDKSTASWMSDYDFTPMKEADAKAILANYSRIDQGLRPIAELTE